MKRPRQPPRVDAEEAGRVVPVVLQADPLPVALRVRPSPARLRLCHPAVALQVRRVVLAVDRGADPLARRLRRPSPRRSIR